MQKIIDDIKYELKKQGLSETEFARREKFDQNKLNRFLRGVTKKLDVDFVRDIQKALGIRTGQTGSAAYPHPIIDESTDAPQTIAEAIGNGYSPEVKLAADYMDVKFKGKTAEDRLTIIEEIMAEIRAKYK